MADELLSVIAYTTLAGMALPVGGVVARLENVQPNWLDQEIRHWILAFGGGVLLAAVAFVLVPEGTRLATPGAAISSLLVGGILFLLIDRALWRRGTPASNLLAALLDFAPEAVALGALITHDASMGALLALFIALQNFPEGFNAYREMTQGRSNGRVTLAVLSGCVLLGPLCGLLGLQLLADASTLTGMTMMFASGGILYLTFQDIAPQVKLERHWGPPLGAVLGFASGLVGNLLLGH